MGACLNRADKTISYYKNGIDLGVAFHNVQEERLYPCIGMQTHDEEVQPHFAVWHLYAHADDPCKRKVQGRSLGPSGHRNANPESEIAHTSAPPINTLRGCPCSA